MSWNPDLYNELVQDEVGADDNLIAEIQSALQKAYPLGFPQLVANANRLSIPLPQSLLNLVGPNTRFTVDLEASGGATAKFDGTDGSGLLQTDYNASSIPDLVFEPTNAGSVNVTLTITAWFRNPDNDTLVPDAADAITETVAFDIIETNP